jgi:integrase
LRPAAAALHYAAANRWCDHWRVKLFREPAPGVRAVGHAAEAALFAAARPGEETLLLLWLFRTGMRIEDTLLRVVWPAKETGGERTGIDLEAGIVRFRAGKTDQYRELALADDLIAALKEVPVDQRQGRLFRWKYQSNLTRQVLARLRRETGVHFTPHMARHTLGARLNEAGAGLRTIMAALGHADVKSSIRYQSADIELVRATINRLPKQSVLGRA